MSQGIAQSADQAVSTTKIDWICLAVTVSLVIIGLIMMFSTSSVVGFSHYNDPYFFIKRHLVFLFVGMAGLLVAFVIPHEFYKRVSVFGLVLAVVLIFLTLIPGLGVKIGGASRWLNLGIIRMQPVEVLKFFIVVYLALYMDNKKSVIRVFSKGLLPFLVLLVIPMFILLKQPDLGNVILICGTVFSLFFVSRVRFRHLAGLMVAGLIALVGIILTHPYQMNRIEAFLFPYKDPYGKSYHIIQSFTAIGSGGFFGLGLGESRLKFFYLPLHYSDFIFAVICEEGGFILGTVVIILFAIFFRRGVNIALSAKQDFSFFLALGLTLMVVGQALINIAVVIGVFPVTGIPLTFISFGGTSLATSLFYVGVLLNISKLRYRRVLQDSKNEAEELEVNPFEPIQTVSGSVKGFFTPQYDR